MKLAELEKLQDEHVENLARLIVDTVEEETDRRSDNDAEDYEPPISYDQLEPLQQEAVLAAAKTIYSKLGYEPFYKYITVEYEVEEVENDGS